MNLKVKIYSDILLACICFSCYMPPVYLFTDARLLPKWYLFVSVTIALSVLLFRWATTDVLARWMEELVG